MIFLTAPTYDPAGYMLLLGTRVESVWQGARRGSVTATLDGSVSVYDSGYSIGDQTLSATIRNPTRNQLVTLQYLVAYYAELVLCVEAGAYTCRMSFSYSNGVATLTLRLLSRLDA